MERTEYQNNIIKRYYQNQDSIMLQKLSELVTELYLADEKKKSRLWKRVEAALNNLKVPQVKINQILERQDPVFLAKFLEGKL